MYIYRNIKWSLIFRFAWKNILINLLWASLVVWAYHYFDHIGINTSIPFLPLSTIGIAVSFYIGFKNNSSYDRFWEARKIWGGIVNYSRTWTNQVLNFISNTYTTEDFTEEELYAIKKELIYRHIGYINALRLLLRRPTSFSMKLNKTIESLTPGTPERKHWNEEVMPFLPQNEYCSLINRANPATQLIRRQGERLAELNNEHRLIEEFRYMEMMRVQEEFYNLQGKCERIKNTPFPRQYAFFSSVFVWIFIILLPFGLVGEFAKISHSFIIMTVPFSTLIAWIFLTMEIVGASSEDPFDNMINDVPMTALCRTIEIDLKDMLGEKELPEKAQAYQGILM